MGLQAASLAMQSEQQAKEYLNQMGVKLIDLANKETPWINIEYDGVDADGNTVRMNQSLPNTPAYKSRIEDLMLNKGGKKLN